MEATDALPQRKARKHMHTPKPAGLRFPEAEPSPPQRARAQGQGPTITMTANLRRRSGTGSATPPERHLDALLGMATGTQTEHALREGEPFQALGLSLTGELRSHAGSELTVPLKGWLRVENRREAVRGCRADPGER